MFSSKRKFLFKCDICDLILSIELEESAEIEKANNNKVVLDCPCGGICKILRD